MKKKTVILLDLPVFAAQYNEENKDEFPNELDDSYEKHEDFKIRNDDNLIIAGKIEDEFSGLEIYVFDNKTYNMYVHHDIMLSSFPICLEWMPYNKNSLQVENNVVEKGNFVILGTFLNEIEIWNIDEEDPVEAFEILNGSSKYGFNEGHLDAVSALEINPFRFNYLLSGSADNYCKIWDLNTNKALLSGSFSKSEVHNVKWNPFNESLYLTSYSDGTIHFVDARENKSISKMKFECDIESLSYNFNSKTSSFVALENGNIKEIDFSNDLKVINSFHAHDKNVTSISTHPNLKDYIISTSLDGRMKIWDINNSFNCIGNQKTKATKLFNGKINDDNPNIFCCGSNIGEVIVWDISEKINPEGMILEN